MNVEWNQCGNYVRRKLGDEVNTSFEWRGQFTIMLSYF